LAENGKGLKQEKTRLYGTIYHFPLGLEGSPYLNDDWQLGDITLVNGEIAYDIKLRLNIIENQLVFYNEGLLRVFSIDKKTLSSFTMKNKPGDRLRNFKKYSGAPISFKLIKNDLIEILHEGNISLYVKHLADVIDSNDLNSKSKVYPKKFYFIQVGDKIVEIRGNTRSVLKYFPENKQQLKKIITANKLRKRREINLVKLIGLMDEDFKKYNFIP
ncbi:MAG: hypothetical protein JW798_16530, partial [Prolixibacteraceae bacterium]|nr:hypothetical protein [Prolixibacteraceae bacterium]